MDSSANAKRRQLHRRDTDDQVRRAIERKLLHIPKRIWVSKRDEHGKSIDEHVHNEIRKRRAQGKYIGSEFWTWIFKSFKLLEDMLAELPMPSDDVSPDKELLEALSILQHENPVKAIAWPFEDYMNHAGQLGETATYGVLQAVMVNGVSISQANAQKAHMATMRWWARTGGCPRFWEAVRPVFDQTLTLFFETKSEQGVKVSTFYNSYNKVIGMFADPEDLAKIFSATDIVEQASRPHCGILPFVFLFFFFNNHFGFFFKSKIPHRLSLSQFRGGILHKLCPFVCFSNSIFHFQVCSKHFFYIDLTSQNQILKQMGQCHDRSN